MGIYFVAQGQVALQRILTPSQKDFMPVLKNCKFEEVAIKTEGTMAQTTFSPFCKSMGPFCCHGNHSFDHICPKLYRVNSLPQQCYIQNFIYVGHLF